MRALALVTALSGVAFADPCLLTSSSWTGDVTLRATADGAAWAKLRGWGRGPNASVALDQVVGASLTGDGLELRVVAETGPWLHARKTLRFGRSVIVGPGLGLTLRDPATLLVEAVAPSGFRPAQPLRATTTCDGLALAAGKSPSLRAATGLPPKQRTAKLRAGVDIPVAADPAGAPEGTLVATDEPLEVELIKQSKGWSLIVVDFWSSVVYGWIPSGFVLKKSEEDVGVLGGIMGGVGGLGLSGVGGAAPPLKRCAAALRVWARQRGHTGAEVGLLRADTPFIARASDPMWSAITLPDLSWLELLPGSELVIAAGDLARCDTRSLDR